MDNERSAAIKIGDQQYERILTTRATKAIAGRYGGFELDLDEIVCLLTLMANHSVLIYNLQHKDAPRELLTEEEVELLTSPREFASYKNAITEAMFKGTVRNVLSASDEKSVSKNTTAG